MSKNDTAPAVTETPAPAVDLSALANVEESDHLPPSADVPEQVKTFVNTNHDHWKNVSQKWRKVELGSAEALGEVVRMARGFATATGRTFRVNRQATNGGSLHFKVTDKISKGNGTQDSTDDEATGDVEE